MAKRKLRIVLLIHPWGFHGGSPISVYFTDRKEDLGRYTRGEGQALRFVLEDADLSSRFAEAIERGLFLEDAKRGVWRLRFKYFNELKDGELWDEGMAGLEKLDAALGEALETGDLIVKKSGILHEISERELTDEDWEVVEEQIRSHRTPLEEEKEAQHDAG